MECDVNMNLLFRSVNRIGWRYHDGHFILKDYNKPGVILPRFLCERTTGVSLDRYVECETDLLMSMYSRRIWFPVPFKRDRELIDMSQINRSRRQRRLDTFK